MQNHRNLRSDDATRTAYARDYGNIVHARPRAVLSPTSSSDIAAIVRLARQERLRIAARGHGHQPFGQAQVKDGIVIDMRSLHTVHWVSEDEVSVDAGASWGNVVSAALERGKTPPVLTNYLPLTVGGTLSVGGVGVASLRHGAQVDHVRELEAVTGTGEVLTCSEREHPALFHALLAGQGQCAVMTRAVMRVVPAPRTAREYAFESADLTAQLRAMHALSRLGWVDGLVALLLRTPDGWSHVIQAVRCFGSPPASDEMKAAAQVKDLDYQTFVNTTAYVESAGARADLGLLLPAPAAGQFLGEVLPRLTGADLGGVLGMRVFLWDRRLFTRPLFRMPDAISCVCIGILREPAMDAAAQERALAGNRELFERARALGGTLYPYAALALTRDDWRRHYADQWSALLAAKRRYDPDDVLASGPDLLLAARSAQARGFGMHG